jgi:hypothetical protein
MSETFSYENDGTYVRTGECCRCGECCWGDPFQGEMGEAPIPGACPLLALAGGRYVCTDRLNSYYLNGCNVWPSHPLQIADKPSCTYKFEKIA